MNGARAAAALLLALAPGCTGPPPRLSIPRCDDVMVIDGSLREPLYARPPTIGRFVVAGEPSRTAPATRAWLAWSPERLLFAFECEDGDVVAAPPAPDEHAVDAQDRVELFLGSGRPGDAYFCIEIGARGAVHDYRAHFYRCFDDAWAPAGLQHAVRATPTGYVVEAALPRAALSEMGLSLEAGTRLRAGLFRADFRSGDPEHPTWITWVDARLPQPDFHVAGSLGEIFLVDRTNDGAALRP